MAINHYCHHQPSGSALDSRGPEAPPLLPCTAMRIQEEGGHRAALATAGPWRFLGKPCKIHVFLRKHGEQSVAFKGKLGKIYDHPWSSGIRESNWCFMRLEHNTQIWPLKFNHQRAYAGFSDNRYIVFASQSLTTTIYCRIQATSDPLQGRRRATRRRNSTEATIKKRSVSKGLGLSEVGASVHATSQKDGQYITYRISYIIFHMSEFIFHIR